MHSETEQAAREHEVSIFGVKTGWKPYRNLDTNRFVYALASVFFAPGYEQKDIPNPTDVLRSPKGFIAGLKSFYNKHVNATPGQKIARILGIAFISAVMVAVPLGIFGVLYFGYHLSFGASIAMSMLSARTSMEIGGVIAHGIYNFFASLVGLVTGKQPTAWKTLMRGNAGAGTEKIGATGAESSPLKNVTNEARAFP